MLKKMGVPLNGSIHVELVKLLQKTRLRRPLCALSRPIFDAGDFLAFLMLLLALLRVDDQEWKSGCTKYALCDTSRNPTFGSATSMCCQGNDVAPGVVLLLVSFPYLDQRIRYIHAHCHR